MLRVCLNIFSEANRIEAYSISQAVHTTIPNNIEDAEIILASSLHSKKDLTIESAIFSKAASIEATS